MSCVFAAKKRLLVFKGLKLKFGNNYWDKFQIFRLTFTCAQEVQAYVKAFLRKLCLKLANNTRGVAKNFFFRSIMKECSSKKVLIVKVAQNDPP